jgi:hypothetical protein
VSAGALNQEYALAQWRREAVLSLGEPALFTRAGGAIWLTVLKNQGWFEPEIKDGVLVGLYAVVFGGIFEGAYNWMRPDTINPKQARKIIAAFAPSGAGI